MAKIEIEYEKICLGVAIAVGLYTSCTPEVRKNMKDNPKAVIIILVSILVFCALLIIGGPLLVNKLK